MSEDTVSDSGPGGSAAVGLPPLASAAIGSRSASDSDSRSDGHEHPASAPTVGTRIDGFDILRVVAATGIVFFHLTTGWVKIAAYAGLPVFLIIMYLLISLPSKRRTPREFVLKRSRRLLIPWLIWSGIYLAVLMYMARDRTGRVGLAPNWLLVGTVVHLWFLPFAMITSIGCYYLVRCTRPWSPIRRCVVFVTASYLLMGMIVLVRGDLVTPYQEWRYSLPALPIALAISAAADLRSATGSRTPLVAVGLALSAGMLAVGLSGDIWFAVPYSVACWLVIACALLPVPSSATARYLASLTLGVYLVHPLIHWTLYKHLGTLQSPVLNAATVSLISFIAIAILHRIKPLRIVC